MNASAEIEAAIQTLVDAKGSGFMNSSDAGLGQLDNWLQHLRHADAPGLRALTTEMEQLQGHFQQNNLGAAATSLQALGEHTAVAAQSIHSFEGTGDKLRQLSQKLVSAAGNLRLVAGAPQPAAGH
ncbi:hypothetical protein [uncultured Hymenobacter sp.]|uniref:hypothetical protein n=1 Tax=uncultured Hymenobacter sp. TaxID=170016 RepID=UPI0035CAE4BD